MEPRLQLMLGFDLMRAAIDGGHDLLAAWNETVSISTRSAEPMPYVFGGAIACLLLCVAALEDLDLLDAAPPGPRDDFLRSGPAARHAVVNTALDAKDAREIDALATAMVNAVLPYRKHLSFAGRLARVPKTS